ncbi:MAG: glycosyltransferase [Clostridia bacterium]|nr:glycosyltransferase [Clostridia bacterium]
MVVVQINFSCTWGSTGKICDSVSKLLSENNIENYIFYTYGKNPQKNANYIRYGNLLYEKYQGLKARVFGNYGFNSFSATRYLIRKLEKIKPDVVHIHNIHGHDCHFEKLFCYLKEKNIKVFYTFHDCWTFTGYCPHFIMAKCDNWLSGCGNCILRRRYSWFFDKSERNFSRKKEALLGLDLTVITPSRWLADLVKQSFLKETTVKVINNGIDLCTFKPSESNFRKTNNLQDKKIVLGVSMGWSNAKGVDVFVRLANSLPNNYQIVLIGTDDKVDSILPNNILSIHRTQNQKELAEIYSAADLFVNPTREENYPTVNMEALACGTPVLTFRTGGSPEMLDATCGSVVDCDDIDALEKEIIRICTEKPYSKEACINKAKEFDKNERFKEYLALYERVESSGN